MTTNESDWQLLNAFADGELGGEDAAVLQRRIESEPALATDLDRIRGLKASLSRIRPEKTQPSDVPPAARFSRRFRNFAIAASIFLAIGVSLAAYNLPLQNAEMPTIAGLHESFSARTYVIEQDARVTISAGAGIGALNAPDLSPSNLTLVDVRTFEAQGSARIAMHYRGRRGCRVTLVADALTAPVDGDAPDFNLVHRWKTSAARFVLVADGMDANRFAAIGAFAEAMSRSSEEREMLRLALVDSTASAQPCALS